MFEVTPAWRSAFPGAHVGVLAIRDVTNPAHDIALEKLKAEIESGLREQFKGQDRATLSGHPVLHVYGDYYRQFRKTYHVQLQLESVVMKGKSIPSVASLVECMFMAEIKNMLLTAGHDLDVLQLPLTLDVSNGAENYTLMRGEEQMLKPGDMFIRDTAGIISDIIYGPDQRTQISPNTSNVVFTVYAPAGIDEQLVIQHLHDMRDYVLIIAPKAKVELLQAFGGE